MEGNILLNSLFFCSFLLRTLWVWHSLGWELKTLGSWSQPISFIGMVCLAKRFNVMCAKIIEHIFWIMPQKTILFFIKFIKESRDSWFKDCFNKFNDISVQELTFSYHLIWVYSRDRNFHHLGRIYVSKGSGMIFFLTDFYHFLLDRFLNILEGNFLQSPYLFFFNLFWVNGAIPAKLLSRNQFQFIII